MSFEVQQLIEQIKKNYNPEKIILFGSYAYGKPTISSDVDIAIIKNTKKRFWDRIRQVNSFIQSSLAADILVYTPKEWEQRLKIGDYFIKEIVSRGKVVYERK
jgi:predicted nucleotidyltransferase